jgi:hypothetical protein
MTNEEKAAFEESNKHIQKVNDNARDLVHRLKMALTSSTNLESLKKSPSLEPKQKIAIDRHIKQVKGLKKPTEALANNVLKLEQAAPDKYANLKALLDNHASFFKNAEEFKTQGTALRMDINDGGKLFYQGTLANVHMKAIDLQIRDILVHYDMMLRAYEKYKPYGPFK